MRFFATAPKGVENLLVDELRQLGATEARETLAGAYFEGPLEIGYRACLWSRVASRILLPLRQFPAPNPEALYRGVAAIRWREHLGPRDSLAVDFSSSGSALAHSQFGAQKTKDAIVDQLRLPSGDRPNVDLEQPSLRINVHVRSDLATLSLDLSGDSLHRRGYRAQATAAPMKENLAAAILLRAGWAELAKTGVPFIDPMCGSGTLPIEAGWIAADVAPGLQRKYFGFLGWRQHQAALWQRLRAEAEERQRRGAARLPLLRGFDRDPRAVRVATANVAQAGLAAAVRIEACRMEDLAAPLGPPGLLVVNPPYGERIGTDGDLKDLYARLGAVLRERFEGWTAWVLTADEELGFAIGLRADRSYKLFNGSVPCRLLKFRIHAAFRKRHHASE